MSSFLKDPQCVAVRTGEHGGKTAAVLPLTQRVAPEPAELPHRSIQ